MLHWINQRKDIHSAAFAYLHRTLSKVLLLTHLIISCSNLAGFPPPLAGRAACGNDFTTQPAPAHYTAHHLHITWTDSIHWSFSKGFKHIQWGSFIETIKQLSRKDCFKGAKCTTEELQRVPICQAISVALWFQFALRKVSNQHLCMLFTSFYCSCSGSLSKAALQQVLHGSSGCSCCISELVCWTWLTLYSVFFYTEYTVITLDSWEAACMYVLKGMPRYESGIAIMLPGNQEALGKI